MPRKTEIWRSFYQDSVMLMSISNKVGECAGIRKAALFMGTPENLSILEEAGLSTPDVRACCGADLILAVEGDNEAAIEAAIETAKALLSSRGQTDGSGAVTIRPHSIDSALRELPDANLAVISIPGQFARYEAMHALRRNLNVFLFSDNVLLEQEVELKREAVARGLFCMGPDCGTSYLNGIGIGFANVIPTGSIGCVAASGTGLQAVVSGIAARGEGISHGIGVGGRDLSASVAGAMTLFALDRLDRDPKTKVVVLVSKPPAPEVMCTLAARLAAMTKPVVVCCLGAEPRAIPGAHWVTTLDAAAGAAVATVRHLPWHPNAFDDPAATGRRLAEILRDRACPKAILGLYTGGTLAYEAELLLRSLLRPTGNQAPPYRLVDLGDDRYTVGRPHPMIEPKIRSEFLCAPEASAGADVFLFDVMLGAGSSLNPADPLAEAFEQLRARKSDAVGIAAVIGTSHDPQDLAGQIGRLRDAGMVVFPSNAQAVRFAAMLLHPELSETLLEGSK